MTDTGDWAEAARWYPDIVAFGDTRTAWQAEFDRQRIPVLVRPRGGVNAHRTATVIDGERHADLLLNPSTRQLRLACWAGRRSLLQGLAPDLGTAAGAAWAWLSGARPGEVAAAWPFLGSVALAEARERGDQREATWLRLHENHCEDRIGMRLQAFVALAFHEPRLRALRPYTSHWTLCFSATSEWPYTRSHAAVSPCDSTGRYVVHSGDGRGSDETDAAGALALVLAELPD